MAMKISQDTFDNVVKENIIDFELDADQAQKETIDQFKAQGVDLTNIITNFRYNGTTGRPILHETIEQLCTFKRNNSNDDDLVGLLSTLTDECQTSVAHRIVSKSYFLTFNKKKTFLLNKSALKLIYFSLLLALMCKRHSRR